LAHVIDAQIFSLLWVSHGGGVVLAGSQAGNHFTLTSYIIVAGHAEVVAGRYLN